MLQSATILLTWIPSFLKVLEHVRRSSNGRGRREWLFSKWTLSLWSFDTTMWTLLIVISTPLSKLKRGSKPIFMAPLRWCRAPLTQLQFPFSPLYSILPYMSCCWTYSLVNASQQKWSRHLCLKNFLCLIVMEAFIVIPRHFFAKTASSSNRHGRFYTNEDPNTFLWRPLVCLN